MTAVPAAPPAEPAPGARLFAPHALARLKTPGKTWGKTSGKTSGKTWGKTWRMNLSDREFLAAGARDPGARRPSPVRLAFLWIICALVVAALTWAYFGRIDIVAAAQGKFQPRGQVKVVEPLETGRVEAIRVSDGSFVRAGDVLVELDRSAALADSDGARAELASARAEILRRKAALLRGAFARFDAPPAIAWPYEMAPALREARDRFSPPISDKIGRQCRRVRRRAGAEKRRARQVSGDHRDAEEPRRHPAGARRHAHAGSSKRRLRQSRGDRRHRDPAIPDHAGGEAGAGPGLAHRRVCGHRPQFGQGCRGLHSDNAQKLEEAERRAEDVRERLAKAEAALDRLTLRAPIAGHVQSSIITNVGQVVTSGQEIMRIVPRDSGLEIQAYVRNRDIGFVSVGEEAVIKIESFPFTRYGVIHARVIRVATDAIPEPTPARSRAIRPASPGPPASRTASARRIWCSRWC